MAILTPRDDILEWWCGEAATNPHIHVICIIKDENPLLISLAEVRLDPLFHLSWLHTMEPHQLRNT
jgi:hypothetical protein